MLDNYLNTVTFEERELLKAQLTKLAGVDEKGDIIDRQGVVYNKGGNIQTVGNTYYYNGTLENTINTNRLELSNDFTVDFYVCMLGITETYWNYIFSFNNNSGTTGFGLAADQTNEWKLVYYNNSHSFFEESTVAGQIGSFIDKWVHITITKSSTDGAKVYINNILKFELDDAIGNITGYPNLVVGNDSGSTKRFNGKIANFKIYNRATLKRKQQLRYLCKMGYRRRRK